MEFSKQTISEFITDLSSEMSSPGGGAVAGLLGALSGSLNSMVYSLTVGKKKYNELDLSEREVIDSFRIKSDEFINMNLNFMEKDRKYFLELMEAYKLPRNTEDEKEIRNREIRDNTIKAMQAPLSIAREGLKFYENFEVMKKYGNRMLFSDLSMAAVLLNCAIESAVINVKVNLNSLREEEFFEKLDKELKDILEKSSLKKQELCDFIEGVIYK